jgi:hypothetical protein
MRRILVVAICMLLLGPAAGPAHAVEGTVDGLGAWCEALEPVHGKVDYFIMSVDIERRGNNVLINGQYVGQLMFTNEWFLPDNDRPGGVWDPRQPDRVELVRSGEPNFRCTRYIWGDEAYVYLWVMDVYMRLGVGQLRQLENDWHTR